jgi:hypothetical protein
MNYMIRCLVLLVLVIVLVVPAHATQNTVYPFGKVTVEVPVDQYINIAARGAPVKVFKQVGGPASNSVARFTPETTVTGGVLTNREVTFGPYTVATTIMIQTGADPAYYSVGALAAALPVLRSSPRLAYTQLGPVASNATATLLASDLMAGIITSTQATGATITLTLPTGTLTDAAAGIQIGQAFEWSLINLSAAAADTVTLAAGTGHTIVGAVLIPSSHSTTGGLDGTNSARFLTRKTAANTFITYRL